MFRAIRSHPLLHHALKPAVRARWPPPTPTTTTTTTTTGPVLHGVRLKHTNMPPRPKPPPESEIDESFLKGSGPGGQKINKTSSAVQLKHLPTGIVVKCQATRSRSQNRTIARQLLADKLDGLTHGDESRASIVGAAKRKKRASSAKKSRRKYRKLEDEKAAAAGDEEGEEVEGEEEDVEEEVGSVNHGQHEVGGTESEPEIHRPASSENTKQNP